MFIITVQRTLRQWISCIIAVFSSRYSSAFPFISTVCFDFTSSVREPCGVNERDVNRSDIYQKSSSSNIELYTVILKIVIKSWEVIVSWSVHNKSCFGIKPRFWLKRVDEWLVPFDFDIRCTWTIIPSKRPSNSNKNIEFSNAGNEINIVSAIVLRAFEFYRMFL